MITLGEFIKDCIALFFFLLGIGFIAFICESLGILLVLLCDKIKHFYCKKLCPKRKEHCKRFCFSYVGLDLKKGKTNGIDKHVD